MDSKSPDQTAHAQSDQGLRRPLMELLRTIKCNNKVSEQTIWLRGQF